MKGETSGNRQWVRGVRLDCDGDALLVLVDQEGAACHTGERSCFHRTLPAVEGAPAMRFGVTTPSREEFAALDRPVVPVTRRLLADSETAVGIYRKLAGNRPGTVLLESAEQGKRWARYSFVGVRSAGVLTERDGVTEWLGDAVPGLTDDLPADPLDAVRTLARRLRSPRVARAAAADRRAGRLPGLRRRPPAGAAARDQHRRPRHARARDDAGDRPGGARPHRRHGAADRQRRWRGAAGGVRRRRRPAGRDGRRPDQGRAARGRGARDRRGAAGAEQPGARASTRRASSGSGSTSGPATPSRSCWPSGSSCATDVDALDLYRVLRATNPSPYMYLLRFAGRETPFDVVGSSPEALVTVTGTSAVVHPPAGTRPRGATGRRTSGSPRACSPTRRSGPST